MAGDTLTNLQSRTRQRADRENDPHIADSELTRHINASYKELWDLLIATSADYFLASSTFTLSGTTSTSTLPSGCYKVRGVDYLDGGYYTAVPHFNLRDRNRRYTRLYRITGTVVRMLPEGNCAGDYRIWYEPGITALSSGSDTLDDAVTPWDEYIVIDAAIKCCVKSEEDASLLMAEKQAMVERIKTMADARDTGDPETITDVYTWDGVCDV